MKWTTKDGTEIPIKKMETRHIESCIRFLQRHNNHLDIFCCEDGDGKPYADADESPIYSALVNEYNRRLRIIEKSNTSSMSTNPMENMK